MRAENRELLGPRDVVLAAHPGSGASWIGTLLVHLGVFYASGEEELLADRESPRVRGVVEAPDRQLPGEAATGRSVGVRAQLEHLPTLRDRDRDATRWRDAVRVVKTNHSAVGWTRATEGQPAPKLPERVVLLVRDGRDAVLSLYHHQVSFSGLDAPLLVYLTGNGGAWVPPATSWAFACMSWRGVMPADRLHVSKFEACRARPLEEFRALLAFLGAPRTDAEIEAAIAASSYDAMRRQESAALEQHGAAIGSGRVMRRGMVGEWREVYTEEMLRTFRGMPRRALAELGYPVDTIPR